MNLTKEQILTATPKLQEIEVPEWGGSVFIRPITWFPNQSVIEAKAFSAGEAAFMAVVEAELSRMQ